ncbi:hypothetical protein ACQZ46_23955 [Agrobacterium salinitolerans]
MKFLPPEWRDHFQVLRDEGAARLTVVDENLKGLMRFSNAILTVASLQHIHDRLSKCPFEVSMPSILEHEMLTSAFVVTYSRLKEIGIARKDLPPHLRTVHDHILELRNQRFAHNGNHHSLGSELLITFQDGQFDLKLNASMGFHVGGRLEWSDLVKCLNEIIYDRLQKQLDKLRQKTGWEWTFPVGPPPDQA